MKWTILLSMVLGLVGCGRMTAPIAPERLSPSAVEDFAVRGSSDGVVLTWRAPESDQRGKPLVGLDAYEVLRHELDRNELVRPQDDEFTVVGRVPDRSYAARREAEAELRKDGRPTRRAQVPADLMVYSFVDTGAEPGREYLYRVVGVNQGSERGGVGLQARVLYRGANSDVQLLRSASGLLDGFEIEGE